jgi:hypothetical protein
VPARGAAEAGVKVGPDKMLIAWTGIETHRAAPRISLVTTLFIIEELLNYSFFRKNDVTLMVWFFPLAPLHTSWLDPASDV